MRGTCEALHRTTTTTNDADAIGGVDDVEVEAEVVVTLRLDALLPEGLWSAGARLWAAENARRGRETCAAWAWVYGR